MRIFRLGIRAEHLVNLMSAQTMLINRRSSLERERAAWIRPVKMNALLFSSDACAEVSTGHVQVFQMHVRR